MLLWFSKCKLFPLQHPSSPKGLQCLCSWLFLDWGGYLHTHTPTHYSLFIFSICPKVLLRRCAVLTLEALSFSSLLYFPSLKCLKWFFCFRVSFIRGVVFTPTHSLFYFLSAKNCATVMCCYDSWTPVFSRSCISRLPKGLKCMRSCLVFNLGGYLHNHTCFTYIYTKERERQRRLKCMVTRSAVTTSHPAPIDITLPRW